jgi:hypothetical protein
MGAKVACDDMTAAPSSDWSGIRMRRHDGFAVVAVELKIGAGFACGDMTASPSSQKDRTLTGALSGVAPPRQVQAPSGSCTAA